ncbi:ABC transporter permease [Leucobacter sp. CSA1]|uniref:Autoinducer 2 import system permease protein LsrC n=1 Tax=Leucobacter chromiisoli TaxID=2796471 RepID=A0A934Q7B5_9MICO|nr:ABC transporter permease [Leucobacter chromiisoli]MBK0418783.1 ABC transporter permease [Leucobacter chromiisoli]
MNALTGNIEVETGTASSRMLKRVLSSRPFQILAVEIVLVVIFFNLSGGSFLNSMNIRGMLITASQVLLLAVAQAILMSAGHIDISQGAVLIFASVIAGKLILAVQGSAPLPLLLLLGLLAAVLAGSLVGIVNGLMVGVVGINALVVTLAMLGIATGVSQVITGGVNLTGLPPGLQSAFGGVTFGVLPLPIIVSLVVILGIWALFHFTSWGTHVLAMGSNQRAAHRVGIRTMRNTIGVFVLSSALAGLAGFVDLARYSTTNISGHTNDSLAAIAAALIGGTLLTGGRINFLGAVLGAFLAIILQSGLVIINLSPFYQTIAIGIMLLVAVSLDRSNRLRRSGGDG